MTVVLPDTDLPAFLEEADPDKDHLVCCDHVLLTLCGKDGSNLTWVGPDGILDDRCWKCKVYDLLDICPRTKSLCTHV